MQTRFGEGKLITFLTHGLVGLAPVLSISVGQPHLRIKNADWLVLGILAHPKATQHQALAVCPALVTGSYPESVFQLTVKF